MRLVSLTIKNYRSIVKSSKVCFNQLSVLVGKNNEGKSNVLHALTLALDIIGSYRMVGLAREGFSNGRAILRRCGYDWEKDYPVSLQMRSRPLPCVLRLEFSLTESEVSDFREVVGSRLNGTLPIEITIPADGTLELKVVKKGPGGVTLARRSSKVCKFVATRFYYSYVPAIRTANEAVEVVEEIVARELSSLESDPEYQKALAKIAALQEPILERISEVITGPLREFVPQVVSASVTVSGEARRRALTRCDIYIDDGVKTSIERKGDGVKSLAAISLLRGIDASGDSRVLALEEPESHLHPDAIHRLKGVVEELSQKHQVVITTHCPLFVNRLDVASNILIDQSSIRSVKNVDEVRRVLGVRASDNLQHARLVVLVEGECDKNYLDAAFGLYSPSVRKALQDGILVVQSVDGASKLSHRVHLYQSSMCDVHVLCDNDASGKVETDKLISSGVLKVSDVNLTVCPGMKESEFEDYLDVDFYRTIILGCGVDVSGREFSKSKEKWSLRLGEAFNRAGKPFGANILKEIKVSVSREVIARPAAAFNEHRVGSLKAFLEQLERRVSGYS